MNNPDASTRGRDSGGHRAREQLLDATPATEQRLVLAGISTAVLIGERTADRPAAWAGRVRPHLASGDPGPYEEPSRGRSRPAGSRHFSVGRRAT